MKNIVLIFILLLASNALYAQFDRLPFSANIELNVPKSMSNKAFVTAFNGNLDWNANISYHYKNKFEFAVVYRRFNFSAGYNDKKYIANLETKFIANAYGVRGFYTYFNNSYFYTQVGLASYYCAAYYNKVTYNNLPIKDPKLNFLIFEPITMVNYKASDYIDIGFQLSTSISTLVFNPAIAHLDEPSKFDKFPENELTNSKTAFISFGFNLKWYLQFEKND